MFAARRGSTLSRPSGAGDRGRRGEEDPRLACLPRYSAMDDLEVDSWEARNERESRWPSAANARLFGASLGFVTNRVRGLPLRATSVRSAGFDQRPLAREVRLGQTASRVRVERSARRSYASPMSRVLIVLGVGLVLLAGAALAAWCFVEGDEGDEGPGAQLQHIIGVTGTSADDRRIGRELRRYLRRLVRPAWWYRRVNAILVERRVITVVTTLRDNRSGRHVAARICALIQGADVADFVRGHRSVGRDGAPLKVCPSREE
jgi:hypothetical protein